MIPNDFQELENIEFLANQVVEGFIIGLHKSPYHGFSVEFAEHRLYNQGESVKDIDWKVFARTEKMYVKRFEEETNLRCQIVIDGSSSMYFPFEKKKGKMNKLEFSIISAGAIMHLLRKQRDAVGLTIFDEKIQTHTQSGSTYMHHKMLFNYLEELKSKPNLNKKTQLSKTLHQIAETLHKRSLIVVFSDMNEDNDEQEKIYNALLHLKHNKHEVIVFKVYDGEKERNFEFENRPYQFIDMETGEEVKLSAQQVRELYTEKVKKSFHDLAIKCGQYKIDLVEADINQDFKQVLLPYFLKRAKMY